MTTTIRIGPAPTARANFIAEAALPAGAEIDGSWEMVDASDGSATPAQVDEIGATPRVSWHVAALAAGEQRTYELRGAAEAPDPKHGIVLDDQSENGCIVVYYGGLLQTMYHYGMPNYRPRFSPNVAPSGRLDYSVGSTDGSHAKSITSDGPPDHTWHRSLWYACGDLNGVDFYLEPAGLIMGYGPHVGTGYGRIMHRSFDWMTSGPVWGGFQQRTQWVAPDGRVLLDDVRRFRMFRLRGRQRLWDIEADFTPHDEPVTFGQTNENALPLMRVADIIDEWDGGTMSLSTGATGSPNCFGQRAEWADCSGPFARPPGQEEEIYGIAMLDHPSNRNHPNAWFVRGYGPIGANLPYFDGALTLAHGETWSLRHRLFIHQGYASEGGVAARFDEYAHPVSASAH